MTLVMGLDLHIDIDDLTGLMTLQRMSQHEDLLCILGIVIIVHYTPHLDHAAERSNAGSWISGAACFWLTMS